MANVHDLKVAIYEIARLDATLVTLTGQTFPVVARGNEGDQELPKIGLHVTSSPISNQTPKMRICRVNFDIRVDEEAADGLEETIADRMEAIFDYNAFAAQGLDVAPRELDRFDLSQLAPEGEIRKGVDYHMELTT